MQNILKRYILYILLCCCITSCGLSDSEKGESKKIIGHIYVFNPHLPEDSGFYLIFRNIPRSDLFLLKYTYVDYLKSNDSEMLIKTKANPEIGYYIIYHNKGDSILSIHNLSNPEFVNYEHTMVVTNYFVADK